MTGYSLCGIAELNVEGSRGFFPLMAWKKGVGTLLKRDGTGSWSTCVGPIQFKHSS